MERFETITYDAFDAMVRDALSHAGEDRRELEYLAMCDSCRILHDTPLPEQRFLFRMFGKPCFPCGELVAITGKAKSGKTSLTVALTAASFRDQALGITRTENRPMTVILFDTEQSESTTQDIHNHRIFPMIMEDGNIPYAELTKDGNPSMRAAWQEIERQLFVYNVRQKPLDARLPMFKSVVRRSRPDLVILDGICDLVEDINDGVKAQEVIEQLTSLASETGCCIVCILHQNKAAEDHTLRGWLGTELTNKAFETYECLKDENRIFTIRQTHTRKYDIPEKLQYVVDCNGIPRLTGDARWNVARTDDGDDTSAGSAALRETNQDAACRVSTQHISTEDEKAMDAFRKAFRPNDKAKPYRALMAATMHIANLNDRNEYYRLLKIARERGVVVIDDDGMFRLGDTAATDNSS